MPALLHIVLLCLLAAPAAALDLGTVGKTYPIAEPDALEELQERAGRIDWKKHLAAIKPERYRPEGLVRLPRATKRSSRLVDLSYVLDIDIPDGKGGILYPRGYTFNPLDYVPYSKTIVVLNGDDRDQVAWFTASDYARRYDVALMLSQGSYVAAGKQLQRPVFYADNRIVNRFQLRAVPSVIRQSGRLMEVVEVNVPKAATTVTR